MGLSNHEKKRRREEKLEKIKQNLMLTEEERKMKATEVLFQLASLDLSKFPQVKKKVSLMLQLWVKYGREFDEIIDVPIHSHSKMEIKLYKTRIPQSYVVLKHNE